MNASQGSPASDSTQTVFATPSIFYEFIVYVSWITSPTRWKLLIGMNRFLFILHISLKPLLLNEYIKEEVPGLFQMLSV